MGRCSINVIGTRVEDSPTSAGVAIDAIRCAKIALDGVYRVLLMLRVHI